MNEIWYWAEDTAVRSVKTFAQALVAVLATNALNVLNTPWQVDLIVAGNAALVCVLHNVSTFPTPVAPVGSGPPTRV